MSWTLLVFSFLTLSEAFSQPLLESDQDGNELIENIMYHYREKDYARVVTLVDATLQSDVDANRARLYLIKADALYFLNDVQGSLDNYLLTVDALSEYSLDTVHLIESYSHTGFCYEYLGRYTEAIPYYHKSLEITRAAKDSVEITNQLSHLGVLYGHIGEYIKATDFFNEAYGIEIARKDTTGLGYELVNFGDLKAMIGDYQMAIEYYKEGLAIKKTRAGNHNTRALRLGKLSKAYLQVDEIDSAEKYSRLALKEAAVLRDSLSLAKFWITQTRILTSKGLYDQALELGQLCHNYFLEASEGEYQVLSAYALVEIYMSTGDFDKADALLSEGLELASRNQLLEDMSLIYQKKSELYEQMGKKGLALDFLRKHQMIDDSVKRVDKQRAIFVVDQEHKERQQRQQIELLQARDQVMHLQLEERRQNIIVLSMLVIAILLISIAVYVAIQKRNQLKNRLLSSQINELRLQIKGIVEGSTDEMGITQERINETIEEPLSEREFEILSLALTDLSNTEISEKTFVSVNTVKYHLKNIYDKLGVSNRKEAMQFALKSTKP
ncbi:MAG: tetratricopeptide repeat protein [Cyclobacteriaceae bacterium]